MEVFAWQIGIILGIGLASVLFGKNGWVLASAAAAIWTLVMIFTSWLMILQFVTVFAGFVWGSVIVESPNYKDNSSNAWGIVIVGIIGVIWAVDHFKNSDNQQQISQNARPFITAPPVQLEPNLNENIVPTVAATEPQKKPDPRLDVVMTEMEQEFPELNSKSQQYNQHATDTVIATWTELQKSGMSEYDALLNSRQAYRDYRARTRGGVVREKDSQGHVTIHN